MSSLVQQPNGVRDDLTSALPACHRSLMLCFTAFSPFSGSASRACVIAPLQPVTILTSNRRLAHVSRPGLNVVTVAQWLVIEMWRGHGVSRLYDQPSKQRSSFLGSAVALDWYLPRVRAWSRMIVKVLGHAPCPVLQHRTGRN